MASHDPRRLVEALRDHLSRHDKPIAFLFGAGTSCAPKSARDGGPLIPAIVQLTEDCTAAVRALGQEQSTAWDGVLAEAESAEGNALIEAALSRVQAKLAALGDEEQLGGLKRGAWTEIDACIRRTIARAVQPSAEEIPPRLPHHGLARWLARAARQRPVELYTTNYDLLLERALEDERIAVFDGFVGAYRPFFCPESLVQAKSRGVVEVRV